MLKKTFTAFENGLFFLAGILLFVLVGIITYSIVMRYLFSIIVPWANQFSEYILLALTFFVASILMKNDEHVKTDLIINILPAKAMRVFHYLTYIISSITCFLLFWLALKVTINNYQRKIIIFDSIMMPKYLLLAIIAIGSLFLFIRCLEKIFQKND